MKDARIPCADCGDALDPQDAIACEDGATRCQGCYEDWCDAINSATNDEFEGRWFEAADYPD